MSEEVKDYLDIATAVEKLPDSLDEAVSIYIESSLSRETSRLDFARTIQNFSLEVEYGLTKTHLASLETFINELYDD